MPSPRKSPLPPARLVALLAVEKRRLLAEKGHVTRQDFDEAWNACWELMVDERAWPHNTFERRGWRRAQWATRTEARAAFLDQPTPFSVAAERLTKAAARSRIALDADDLPHAIAAAYAAARDKLETLAAAA